MLFGNSENFEQKCEFGADAVVYLYGELNEADSEKFGKHLEDCGICADEIAAFSAIHLSIRDWKTSDFDNLSNPVIEIPFDGNQNGVSTTNWLTNLRELFSPSRILIPVGGLATILILAGLSFYIFSSRTQTEFAANVSESFENSENISKTEQSSSENNQALISDELEKNERVSIAVNEEDKTVEKSSAPEKPAIKIEKTITERKKSATIRSVKSPKPSKTVTAGNNRNLPKLNDLPDEDDDEDLRLTDLFDEIGGK